MKRGDLVVSEQYGHGEEVGILLGYQENDDFGFFEPVVLWLSDAYVMSLTNIEPLPTSMFGTALANLASYIGQTVCKEKGLDLQEYDGY